jgi:DNA polymerase III epsilon subunit family exonuclease
MFLNPAFRYISIDFETTGLDTKKDEILQIGLVVFDHMGEVVDTFSSYIKPTSSEKLTSMVHYVTGIDEKDIAQAPSIADITATFVDFFDEKTVIIGHNIDFDKAFLDRFFPGLPYLWSIDTYPRAQNFVHFVPSFALEVICQQLKENKESFAKLWKKFALEEDGASFHDALYDAKSAAVLYIYIVQQIHQILHTYPQAKSIRNRMEHSLFHRCIHTDTTAVQTSEVISLPVLKKSITTPNTMVKKPDVSDLSQFPRSTHLYTGNMTPQQISTMIAQHKNTICVFSHKSKADIIKHLLHDQGVYGIATLYEETFFDAKRFDILLRKPTFSLQEGNFLYKYLSHHMQGLGILDIQQEYEKSISYFLQEKKPNHKAPLVFATHGALYRHIQKYPDFYKDYTICFFDQDRWYVSYNDFASYAYDCEYFLQMIEKVVYTYDVCYQAYPAKYEKKQQSIQQFYSVAQIFVGVLSMDVAQLFEEYGSVSMQIDPPLYHHAFYRTQKMWDRMLSAWEQLQSLLPQDVIDDIAEYYNQLQMLLSTIITIDKRHHISDGTTFVYKETNRYIQRHEFQDIFQDRRVLFFSHHSNQGRVLQESKKSTELALEHISATDTSAMIDDLMQTHDRIYIVSTQKQRSQGLFDKLCADWLHTKYTILAENITGWMGKNIFLAQRAHKTIIIGGYSFYLQALAKRLYVDKVLVFFIKWSMEKLLLRDIQRYGIQ